MLIGCCCGTRSATSGREKNQNFWMEMRDTLMAVSRNLCASVAVFSITWFSCYWDLRPCIVKEAGRRKSHCVNYPYVVTYLIVPWRWRQEGSSRRNQSTKLHGVTFQKPGGVLHSEQCICGMYVPKHCSRFKEHCVVIRLNFGSSGSYINHLLQH
jgi:hypothetical protein